MAAFLLVMLTLNPHDNKSCKIEIELQERARIEGIVILLLPVERKLMALVPLVAWAALAVQVPQVVRHIR